jgi:hypothetical protein
MVMKAWLLTVGLATPKLAAMNTHPAENVLRELGGLTAVARLFEVRVPSVCGWKRGIPPARLQTLRAWAQLPAGARLPNSELTPERVRLALRHLDAKTAKPKAVA